MRIARYDLRPVMIIILGAVLLTGCSGLFHRTSEPEDLAAMAEARMVLLALGSQNDKLTSFKGIGKIKVWQKGEKRIDERIAWIGSETVKLSIVVLISGHPAIKMASDGKWFYYYEARPGEPLYKKIPATDATLQRIVAVPIQPIDIIVGYVLVLEKRWYGIIEKIYLDEDKIQVRQIEFFNRSGSLIYRARFDEMQAVNKYQVPTRLSISSDEGMGFQLEVQKYWADVPVSPSMFVLDPPE